MDLILDQIGETELFSSKIVIGFMTTKGELVRAILFPPPLDFRFHRDFLRSLYVFLTLGLIGMAYSLYVWIKIGVQQNLLYIFCMTLIVCSHQQPGDATRNFAQ